MNKKKLTGLVASLALVGVVGLGATLAYFTDSDKATNTIVMGHVDVDLTEPEFDKNPDKTIENVTPGQEIVKDPTVAVKEGSNDSYIRVSMNVEGLNEEQKASLLAKNADGSYKNLDINMSDWKESADGYFYYVGTYAEGQKEGVLKAGQEVKLFNTVKIPTTWGNDAADVTFTIDVKAEAIQADNFTPTEVNGNYGWFDEGQAITADTYKAK